jgi:hypothetical protein
MVGIDLEDCDPSQPPKPLWAWFCAAIANLLSRVASKNRICVTNLFILLVTHRRLEFPAFRRCFVSATTQKFTDFIHVQINNRSGVKGQDL